MDLFLTFGLKDQPDNFGVSNSRSIVDAEAPATDFFKVFESLMGRTDTRPLALNNESLRDLLVHESDILLEKDSAVFKSDLVTHAPKTGMTTENGAIQGALEPGPEGIQDAVLFRLKSEIDAVLSILQQRLQVTGDKLISPTKSELPKTEETSPDKPSSVWLRIPLTRELVDDIARIASLFDGVQQIELPGRDMSLTEPEEIEKSGKDLIGHRPVANHVARFEDKPDTSQTSGIILYDEELAEAPKTLGTAANKSDGRQDLGSAWIKLRVPKEILPETLKQVILQNFSAEPGDADVTQLREELSKDYLFAAIEPNDGIWVELPEGDSDFAKKTIADRALKVDGVEHSALVTQGSTETEISVLWDDQESRDTIPIVRKLGASRLPGLPIFEFDPSLNEKTDHDELPLRIGQASTIAGESEPSGWLKGALNLGAGTPDVFVTDAQVPGASSDKMSSQKSIDLNLIPDSENEVKHLDRKETASETVTSRSFVVMDSRLKHAGMTTKGEVNYHKNSPSVSIPQSAEKVSINSEELESSRRINPLAAKEYPPVTSKRAVQIPAKILQAAVETHEVENESLSQTGLKSNKMALVDADSKSAYKEKLPESSKRPQPGWQPQVDAVKESSAETQHSVGAKKQISIISRFFTAESDFKQNASNSNGQRAASTIEEKTQNTLSRAESNRSSDSHSQINSSTESEPKNAARPRPDGIQIGKPAEPIELIDQPERSASTAQKGESSILDRNQVTSNLISRMESPKILKMAHTESGEIKEAVRSDSLRNAIDQIVQSAKLRIAEGRQEIQVKLKPEFLGMVKIIVESTEQETKAVLFVERQELRQALEGQLPQLQKSLQEQNIKMDRLEIRDFSTQLNSKEGWNGQNSRQDMTARNAMADQTERFLGAEGFSPTGQHINTREFGYNTLELIA